MDFKYRCPAFLYESLQALAGFERFLVVIGCGAITTLLLILGHINIETYNSLTMATIGVYVAGSAVEAFANRKGTPQQ